MKTISVIIPAYNSKATIECSIESIIKQTYHDYEIVIIDGNSTDNTVKIIQEYAKQYDFIRYLSEKDSGPYEAMNKGIDLADGQWLLFLGSSDLIYSENTFETIFKEPIARDIGLLYGNIQTLDDTQFAKAGDIYDGKFTIEKLLTKNICHQAIFYKKSLFKKLGKYNIKYPVTADWEMNMRFFAQSKVHYVDIIVAYFSGGGLSSRTDIQDPIYKELPYLRKKYFRNYLLCRKIIRKIKFW